MILIADSGSTKTDWTLIHSPHPMRWDVIATFQSQGITPIHQTPDEIRQILARELMSQLSTFPRAAQSAGRLAIVTNQCVLLWQWLHTCSCSHDEADTE